MYDPPTAEGMRLALKRIIRFLGLILSGNVIVTSDDNDHGISNVHSYRQILTYIAEQALQGLGLPYPEVPKPKKPGIDLSAYDKYRSAGQKEGQLP